MAKKKAVKKSGGNLIPFPKKLAKEMGIQFDKKQGVMVDKGKLSDFKKFTRPKAEEPEVVKEKVEEAVPAKSAQDKQREEDLGIF